MAMTDLEICNLALSWVGEKPITSLTAGGTVPDLCLASYAPVRRACLEAGEWSFAIERREVAADQSEAAPGTWEVTPVHMAGIGPDDGSLPTVPQASAEVTSIAKVVGTPTNPGTHRVTFGCAQLPYDANHSYPTRAWLLLDDTLMAPIGSLGFAYEDIDGGRQWDLGAYNTDTASYAVPELAGLSLWLADGDVTQRNPAFVFTFAIQQVPGTGRSQGTYPKPSDMIRVLSVLDAAGGKLGWSKEGDNVLVDGGDSVFLRGICYVTDTGSPEFDIALAHRLASVLAIPLTENKELAVTEYQLYERHIARAKTLDNSQGTPERIRSSYLTARRQG